MLFFRYTIPCLTVMLCFALIGMDSEDVQAVVAPSTFSSSIQVQGEVEGTEFDDWAGIPIAYTDNGGVADNTGFLDLDTVQIANDDDNLYIRVTLLNTTPIGLATMHLAFDLDNDPLTGDDIFDLGAIGSELGYQTDYPFQQANGVFNTGVEGVVDYDGDFIGLAVTFPFFDDNGPPAGTQMEWAIPRSLAIGPAAPGTPVFTGDTFTLMTYSDLGAGDLLNNGTTLDFESLEYTFAENPNPSGPGDFDDDGDVDGNDFLIWQRGGSTTGPLNAQDLSDWQTNYGAPPLSNVTAVPEPSSLLLACLGLTAFGVRRRRD